MPSEEQKSKGRRKPYTNEWKVKRRLMSPAELDLNTLIHSAQQQGRYLAQALAVKDRSSKEGRKAWMYYYKQEGRSRRLTMEFVCKHLGVEELTPYLKTDKGKWARAAAFAKELDFDLDAELAREALASKMYE